MIILILSSFVACKPNHIEGLRDECGCPICPKCRKCPECRECPKCPQPLPCPSCPECPDVGRCRMCPVCRECAPPVVFYVPKGALIDPLDAATPSRETENLIPGMCCRCPKRGSPAAADASKFIDNSTENAEEMRRTTSLQSRIEEYTKRFEENELKLKKLKRQVKKYRDMLY